MYFLTENKKVVDKKIHRSSHAVQSLCAPARFLLYRGVSSWLPDLAV